MRHAMPSLANTLVLSTMMSIGGICYGWLGLGDPPAPVVLHPKWPTGWCHQRSEGSWLFALQFVVHLEIHRGSPSSPSPISVRMLNKYGAMSQLCQTPFLTRNHSDCSCYFDLRWLFLVQFGQQVNQVQMISHHSYPELIMRNRVESLECFSEVHKSHIDWLLVLTCIAHQYSEIRDLVIFWSLVPFLVGIPPVRLQFLFRSSLG